MLITNKEEQKQYNYKEYALKDLNNRNNLTTDMAGVIKDHPTDQLYQSFFDHSQDIFTHWSTTFNRNGKNTITGYSGAVSLTDVIIDIDLQHGESDLEISRSRAGKVLDRLRNEFGVNLIYVYSNFSGAKGFHIRIPSELFGEFDPSEDLPTIVREIVKEIVGDVAIDESVYKTTGLMRVPNTINMKTKLYAIPLTAVDITNLNIAAIKKKAMLPATALPTYPDHFTPVLKLVELKKNVIDKLNIKTADKIKNAVKPTVIQQARDSVSTFNTTDNITLANGKKMMVSEIIGKTPVFCPFCQHDKRSHATANAFIDINDKNQYYIYCSSESKTFWQKNFDEKGIFTKGTHEYYKMIRSGKEFVETQLTSFIIEPKELLKLDDSDVLKCDIKTVDGAVYTDKLISNNDWTSKTSLLRAIGNQDCNFLGSDPDVQPISQFVNKRIPVVKKGTKTIGLIEDKWVLTNRNFDKNGELKIQEITPSEKGAQAFHNKIDYPVIPDKEMDDLIKGFYENILKINRPETIVPFVLWGLIAPLKAKFLEFIDGFPHVFVHGNMGGGKTSTALMLMRLWGYNTKGLYSCTLNPFPMLKLMSSTNGIPIVFDEFKKQDLTDFHLDQMHRMMRRAYSNEVETKGKADLTINDFPITAPMVVMGEWRITQPAVRERSIISSFTTVVKQDPDMQLAFENLRDLALESFMNWYIRFALGQDVKALFNVGKQFVTNHFEGLGIDPRVLNNLAIFYVGYMLFNEFAKENGIVPPVIDMKAIMEHQLEEITGNKTGQVQSSVDQLVEALSAMAADTGILADYDFRIFEDKKIGVKGLAIPIKDIMPRFKEWVRRTDYDIEILDLTSYRNMFDETKYIVEASKKVKLKNKSRRCIFINIKEAQKIGLDIEGMVGLSMSQEERVQLENDSYL